MLRIVVISFWVITVTFSAVVYPVHAKNQDTLQSVKICGATTGSEVSVQIVSIDEPMFLVFSKFADGNGTAIFILPPGRWALTVVKFNGIKSDMPFQVIKSTLDINCIKLFDKK